MKHLRTAWLASLMALALLLGAGTARADDESERLAALGKAHTYTVKTTAPMSPIETGGAAILVDAPIEDVRKVVTNYGAYQKFLKPFDQSRVLSKRKGVSEVYLQVPVLHGAANIWAITEIAAPVKRGNEEVIVGKLKKGNVDDFRAVWRLRSAGPDKTVLKLELLVDPALPFGASLVTKALVHSAAKGVGGVKKRAEEAYAKRPGAKKAAEATAKNTARAETTEVASQTPAEARGLPAGDEKALDSAATVDAAAH
ncbi:SRPBCC family protein [Chondromyces apiculatus]|uniref:Coenzyme Q-binding protein COQ10 START domain-containing protein n=1 Tax=Chondromyces apiculatus DSM 436 TaxID=1192034 RepID=A0A017THP7_9BACT|nr:SRPBCC family protein [Chondromyces apiculatus]EYF08365.1 Hypothetical protein CAP_4981 [Chondromyces apiculatus DSM 436]